MPSPARRPLVLACAGLLALGLVSCFHDVGDCPTCPQPRSSSLDVVVSKNGLVDSVHVAVDGGAQVTVRRDRRHTFAGLSRGDHDVLVTRWFFIDGLLSSRTSTVRVRLERGEARTLVFHNDFPLIAAAPAPPATTAGRGRPPLATLRG